MGFRTADLNAFQICAPDAKFRSTPSNWIGLPGGFGDGIFSVNLGVAPWPQSRAELPAGPPGRPGRPSDPARCEGRVGRIRRDTAHPIQGSTVLAFGNILDGMTPDSPPAKTRQKCPSHVCTYKGLSNAGRVFTTTHGASEDLRNEGVPPYGRQLTDAGGGFSLEHQAGQRYRLRGSRSIRRHSD